MGRTISGTLASLVAAWRLGLLWLSGLRTGKRFFQRRNLSLFGCGLWRWFDLGHVRRYFSGGIKFVGLTQAETQAAAFSVNTQNAQLELLSFVQVLFGVGYLGSTQRGESGPRRHLRYGRMRQTGRFW